MIRHLIADREDRFFATVFLGSGLLFVAMLFIAAGVGGSLMVAVKFHDAPVPEPDTVTTVRSLAGAPAEGSRWRKSVIESAWAQAGPLKRPSREIGTVAATTRNVAAPSEWFLGRPPESTPCCAASLIGSSTASATRARIRARVLSR